VMGQQIHYYMLPEDCAAFVHFVRHRFPAVVFLAYETRTADLSPLENPCDPGSTSYMWNRSVVANIQRLQIGQDAEAVYRLDTTDPIVELWLPAVTEWDGKAALVQGRIYASFDKPNDALKRWFAAMTRWIRRHFVRNENTSVGGYAGPAALRWHREGGIFLPTFKPPLTPAWRSILS